MKILLENQSFLELERLKYRPPVLNLLNNIKKLKPVIDSCEKNNTEDPSLCSEFPFLKEKPFIKFEKTESISQYPCLQVGVVLSGGPAPGGHNVVIGLYEGLKKFNNNSKLFGFLNGPLGLVQNEYKELDVPFIYNYYNTGGFDMLSYSREKISTWYQRHSVLKSVKKLNLDALLIIGGDDSNTNTAILAEFFAQNNIKTKVIGVPKTIDGDLKNKWIEIPFGFDTACKIYSEMISNLAFDSMSANKYVHVVRLMGQSTSHVTLECALQTQPNIALISEEISYKKKNLKTVSQEIAQLLHQRMISKKNYGLLLFPEGLIEQISDTRCLIKEINSLLTYFSYNSEKLISALSSESLIAFNSLPKSIQSQILEKRDPHGNVKVSKIATEELIIHAIQKELKTINSDYKQIKFVPHFFGYEARSGYPSNFDANYGLALGIISSLLINHNLSGYMTVINNLSKDYSKWTGKAIPLFSMLHLSKRDGKLTPVIKKGFVDISSSSFQYFKNNRKTWCLNNNYIFTGPIQFFGNEKLINLKPKTLLLDHPL